MQGRLKSFYYRVFESFGAREKATFGCFFSIPFIAVSATDWQGLLLTCSLAGAEVFEAVELAQQQPELAPSRFYCSQKRLAGED
jgi:hypothetical protein